MESDLKTVLVFARFFPPMPDVGGRRFADLGRHLPEVGWRVVVVTDPHVDVRMRAANEQQAEVVNRFYPSWWPAWKHGSSPGAASPAPRSVLQEGIPGGLGMLTIPFRGKALDGLIARFRPDAVIGSYSPPAALALARSVSRKARIPYIADMRDPWTLRPEFQDKPRATRHIESKMETDLLLAASAVVFTAESARQAYQERMLGDCATDTIRNSIDLEGMRTRLAGDRGQWAGAEQNIVHFGNVYGRRSLGDVLHAIAKLERPEKIRLVNFGNVSRQDLQLSGELGIAANVKLEASLPYRQGLEALNRSALKLLVGFGVSDLFIPTKFYDYAATHGPTLCIAPKQSELANLTRELEMGYVIEPGDRAGIREVLQLLLADELTPYVPDPDRLAFLGTRQAALRYGALLDRLVDDGR